GAHVLGGVKRIVHLKMRGIAGSQGIVGSVALDPEPLDVWTAITEILACQCQLGSATLHELVVVPGLRQSLTVYSERHQNSCDTQCARQCEKRSHLLLQTSL